MASGTIAASAVGKLSGFFVNLLKLQFSDSVALGVELLQAGGRSLAVP